MVLLVLHACQQNLQSIRLRIALRYIDACTHVCGGRGEYRPGAFCTSLRFLLGTGSAPKLVGPSGGFFWELVWTMYAEPRRRAARQLKSLLSPVTTTPSPEENASWRRSLTYCGQGVHLSLKVPVRSPADLVRNPSLVRRFIYAGRHVESTEPQ